MYLDQTGMKPDDPSRPSWSIPREGTTGALDRGHLRTPSPTADRAVGPAAAGRDAWVAPATSKPREQRATGRGASATHRWEWTSASILAPTVPHSIASGRKPQVAGWLRGACGPKGAKHPGESVAPSERNTMEGACVPGASPQAVECAAFSGKRKTSRSRWTPKYHRCVTDAPYSNGKQGPTPAPHMGACEAGVSARSTGYGYSSQPLRHSRERYWLASGTLVIRIACGSHSMRRPVFRAMLPRRYASVNGPE